MAALICILRKMYSYNQCWKGLIWFFTHQNVGVDTKIVLIWGIVTKILKKTTFSVMAALICILRKVYCYKQRKKGLKGFFANQNMGVDTKIILMPCIVNRDFEKKWFSVMAALICILRWWPEVDRVASTWFLRSIPQRYRIQKDFFFPTLLQGSPRI